MVDCLLSPSEPEPCALKNKKLWECGENHLQDGRCPIAIHCNTISGFGNPYAGRIVPVLLPFQQADSARNLITAGIMRLACCISPLKWASVPAAATTMEEMCFQS